MKKGERIKMRDRDYFGVIIQITGAGFLMAGVLFTLALGASRATLLSCLLGFACLVAPFTWEGEED